MREWLRDAVLGGGAVFIVLDAFVMSFDLLLAMSDVLFPLLAVMTGELSNHFEFLGHPWMQHLFIVVALAYVINLTITLTERVREKRDS